MLNIKLGTAHGNTNVPLDAFVAVDVAVVHAGQGVNRATINSQTVQLYPTALGPNHPVLAQRNIDGGEAEIVDQPINLLAPNTQYTFTITSGVQDLTGASIVPFTYTFTTGTTGPTPNPAVSFTKVPQPITSGTQYTDVVLGPDGRVWASTMKGLILAFPLDASGNLGTPQTYDAVQKANGGSETITGITFDPSSTAAAPVVWVTGGQYALSNAKDFTGILARLSGPDLTTYQNYVTGLPRSVGNHMTNQSAFGPDGALYISQGSNTAMGAPDPIWGYRAEDLLNAAILRVDTAAITQRIANGQGALNVATGAAGNYDPAAAGAPLTIYATGIRNAYDILWASNGHLYAPTNGSSAGGNTPASPTNPALANTNIKETEWDWLFDVKKGKYYGHPDPARKQFILNDGNVTGDANDPLQLPEYPVGTQPGAAYTKPAYIFGPDYSPDGIIQYHGSAFGGALDGHLLITRYSAGKDIIDLTLNADGSINSTVHVGSTGMTGLGDPLSLTEAPNGDLFVVDYGTNDIIRLSDGAAGIATPPIVTPTPTPDPTPTPPPVQVVVPPPTALTATPQAGGIVLNWTGSVGNNVAGYNVYSGPSATGPFTKLNAAPLSDAPPYTDSAAATGVVTYYEVTAVDTSGNESVPDTINATLAGTTPTPPGGGGVGGTTGGGGTPEGVAFDMTRVQTGKAKLLTDTIDRRVGLKADQVVLRSVTLSDNALIRADQAKLKADLADPSTASADQLQIASDRLKLKVDVAAAKSKLKVDGVTFNKLLAADKAEIRLSTHQLTVDRRLLRKGQKKK